MVRVMIFMGLYNLQTARTHAEKVAREAERKLAEKDQKDRSKGAMSKGTLDRDAKEKAERCTADGAARAPPSPSARVTN